MGWRFRKSTTLLPGIKINFNKNSTSITLGKKGIHHTINSKGRRTTSLGIPGTGIYYTQSSSSQTPKTTNHKSNIKGCLIPFFIILCLFVSCTAALSNSDNSENSNTQNTEATIETTYEETEPSLTLYTTTSLNVRNGPGTEYAIIETLAIGTPVVIVQTSGDWAEIEHSQSPAYVSLSYLSDSLETQATKAQEPLVWISHSGKKYHSKASCSGMKGPEQVTLSQAQRRGKTPCKKCY